MTPQYFITSHVLLCGVRLESFTPVIHFSRRFFNIYVTILVARLRAKGGIRKSCRYIKSAKILKIIKYTIFFFFRLFPSGVATANCPSPFVPIFCQPHPCPLSTHQYSLVGLPRFLFPGISILSILLPIHSSSFLRTCPYHLISTASRVSLQTVPPVLSL